MGSSLSSKISNMKDLSKKLNGLKVELNENLSNLYYELKYAGVCVDGNENCQPNIKLIAVQSSSLLNGLNKSLLRKQKQNKSIIPYKIESVYDIANNKEIENSIKDSKEYINYKLKLYKLLSTLNDSKYFCIQYSSDIANIASIIYEKVKNEVTKKKIKINPSVEKNLKDVSDKVIKLLQLNISYISTFLSIITQLNDHLDLENLRNLKNQTFDLFKNEEKECCEAADILQELALFCDANSNCENIFTGEKNQKIPNYENVKLKNGGKSSCDNFIKIHFNDLAKIYSSK